MIGVLLLSLLIGASYRAVEVEETFGINKGSEAFINMASYWWSNPGAYNFERYVQMMENPNDYIYSSRPKEPATGSFENEKGWAFILSIILKEGTSGIHNLALTIVRYQMILDLFVIVLLFWAGRALAGSIGGGLAAILYATFIPSINMVSWVSYYYWAVPFSALSLVFWTAVYKPERRTYPLRYASVLFFLYGMVMGFAVSVRLNFLFLPLFLSPLIFVRERAFKRSLVLLLAMLIGQGILLVPQVLITYKHYGKLALSVRGKWHHVVSGFGSYPNPFGLKDSGDLTAVNWAIERGGPDLNKLGIQEYDRFMKKEAIRLIKERPDIFLRNFKNNFYTGITLTPHGRVRYIGGPGFYGIIESDTDVYLPKILKLACLFPWLVFFSIFILFFFWHERFWPFISIMLQGLYVVAILCIYFPPVDVHSTAYFPVFVLLLAVAVTIFVRGVLAFLEGALRCWINDGESKQWLVMVEECFREDWDEGYRPQTVKQYEPAIKILEKWRQWSPKVKRLFIPSVILLFVVALLITRTGKHTINEKPDDKTVQMINTLLTSETSGNFESWSSGESSPPDEWGFTQIHGKGGEIHRATGDGKVRAGVSSVEVRASSSASSQLHFYVTPDKLYSLAGKAITVEGWVKSDNKRADKVYICIYNGIDASRYPKTYYHNSGDWEKLTLSYKIPEDITSMFVILNVDSGADAPAYFDGISLKYDPTYTSGGIIPTVRTVEEEKLYYSGLLSLKEGDYYTTISTLKRLEVETPHSALTLTLEQKIREVEERFNILVRLSLDPYVIWNMNTDTEGEIADSKGKHNATSFNADIVEGHSEEARYFNGKNSYVQTPVSFQGWKSVTISFWVKPEQREGDELSVILDNGHDAKNNFAIQSADFSGERWVWHCNGIDIFFALSLNKWSNVVVVADGEKGIVRTYVNGLRITEVRSDKGFEFGPTPLTIGKLTKADERYFKGTIDEVVIWDMPLDFAGGL
ncbi:MAG: LamG domain-containing protein [Candidatus Brocadiales bacterium]|nr:LamG domain-containing protein [Candidatus Brocadiales bacterium]